MVREDLLLKFAAKSLGREEEFYCLSRPRVLAVKLKKLHRPKQLNFLNA
jgi:hypothetical protein